MAGLTWSPALVARAYDANNNGRVDDDLKIAKDMADKLDGNKDGKIDRAELAAGIDKDILVIRGDVVSAWAAKKAANAVSPFDAKLDAANGAIVGAEQDVAALAPLKGELTAAITHTAGRHEVAAGYIDLMIRASHGRPNAREKDAIAGLQGLQSRANAKMGQLRAVNLEAPALTLAQKAREVYEMGVALLRGEEAPTASQTGRASITLDRLAADAAAIGAKAKADKAVIQGPRV